jgi:hypothetical protein
VSADLSLSHCEQSPQGILWEGDKSRLASPDTGLIAHEQKKAREAASWHSFAARLIYKRCLPPAFLLIINVPAGSLEYKSEN